MNRGLTEILSKINENRGGYDGTLFLDEYNQTWHTETVPTITTRINACNHYHLMNDRKIRRLTPRECFRLMGVKDEEIDKIQAAGISDSKQYQLAGNSIVVEPLAAIFTQMFINTNTLF